MRQIIALSKHTLLLVLIGAGASCTATPIEIPFADGGAAADSGSLAVPDTGLPPPTPPRASDFAPETIELADVEDDSFGFDQSTGSLPTITALHANSAGLYVATGTAIWHWSPAAADATAHSAAPAPVSQIATSSGSAPRLYLASEVGVHSVTRAGGDSPGSADLQTHYSPPAGGTFDGGIAVGQTWLFVSDPGARVVVRLPLAGSGAAQELYSSPYQQATTLSRPLAALGDQLFFADLDGPMQADGQATVQPLGVKRTDYRWAGAVATADALLVAQAGDLTEALTRIALPGGSEQALLWIGGANNNAGLRGPVLLGDRLAWSASSGVYLTDLNSGATVRIAQQEARLAGDGAQTLYWAPLGEATVHRAVVPAP